MTWYRFHGICGPGHQSSWEEYRWLKGEWSDDALEEEWKESIPRWAEYSGNSTGSYEVVLTGLPPEVHAEKVLIFQSQLTHAKRMLEILNVKEEDK